MDIVAWLRKLGLEQYERAFVANDIDLELLPRLTAADLEAIGVTSVGHRRRLLDGIQALNGAAEPAEALAEAADESADRALPKPAVERRQLTVMFVDLVGSSTLSERLDPEDLRTIILAYQQTCSAVIEDFDGFVAKYLGDGVLAYFGWPSTREDEAERAVRAGLAIVEATARLSVAGQPISARVGIATGLVVVGDLIGEGAAKEEAVVGETPNLAARLQQLAEPGTVVIADTTRRLLGGSFHVEALGSTSVRGFSDSMSLWRAIDERGVVDRFEARRALGLTEFVGREREVALLLDRWDLAKGGEGQLVLLSGEPGIGKSRITDEVSRRLGDPVSLLHFQCSPQNVDSALHPIIARLEASAGISRNDRPDARLVKLESFLAKEFDDASSVVPLIATLLGIPFEGRYPPLSLTPRQQKAKTLEALARGIQGVAARQPALLIFEDIHWADPTSLEFLDIVASRIDRLPVLAILTFRPEFVAAPSLSASATLLSLNKLGHRDAVDLVRRVATRELLSEEVLEQILARTDGVPLFVEELTKAVLESRTAAAGEVGRASSEGPIPLALRDSLMARLDRLGRAKEIVQLAACLGREFSHEILAAVSPLEEDEFESALDRLTASGLVHRVGPAPLGSFVFRHALLQEAAYQSLLKSDRRRLHARIGVIVEAQFPDLVAQRPEWLAYHFAAGDDALRASDYWLRAARRAKDTYALREAAGHLQKCLEQAIRLESLPGRSADAHALECLALELLGDVASLMGQLEPANRYYQRAIELAQGNGQVDPIRRKLHLPRVAMRSGAKVAYYEHGGGDVALLIVSPLGYGLATIQPVLEHLSQDFRIITIDARGSGASDPLTRPYPIAEHVRDVRAVLTALKDTPMVGVGISAGGNVLLKLAHQEPHLFTKLVTVGTPPSNDAFDLQYMRAREEALRRGDIETLLRTHTELIYHEPEMRELQQQVIKDRSLLPGETILSFFEPDPSKDVTGILHGIRLPTLVMHGRDDHLIAFSAAEKIANALPNAQLYPFEGKGHLPIFTATEEFCRVLGEFAREGVIERLGLSRQAPETGADAAAFKGFTQ